MIFNLRTKSTASIIMTALWLSQSIKAEPATQQSHIPDEAKLSDEPEQTPTNLQGLRPLPSHCEMNFVIVPRSEWTKADLRLEWALIMAKNSLREFQNTKNIGGTKDLLRWAGYATAAASVSAMAGHSRENGEDLLSYYLQHDPLQLGSVVVGTVVITVLSRAVYLKMKPGRARRKLQRTLNKLNSSLEVVLTERGSTLPNMVESAMHIKLAMEESLALDPSRNPG